MMYSKEITEKAAEQFLKDLEVSEEYSCEKFEQSTMMMRIRMAVSRHLILLA